jgi:hypothetical protein
VRCNNCPAQTCGACHVIMCILRLVFQAGTRACSGFTAVSPGQWVHTPPGWKQLHHLAPPLPRRRPFSRGRANVLELAAAFDLCVGGEALHHIQQIGAEPLFIPLTQVGRSGSCRCWGQDLPAAIAPSQVGSPTQTVPSLCCSCCKCCNAPARWSTVSRPGCMQTQLLSRAGLCADVAGAEGAHPEDAAGGRADDAHVRRWHQRRGRPEGSPRGSRASGTQQGALKAQILNLTWKQRTWESRSWPQQGALQPTACSAICWRCSLKPHVPCAQQRPDA